MTFADPYDITSAYLAVCQALDMAQHDLADDRVIVDITGSTKVVTAGAALACRDRGQRIEYMVVPRSPTGEPIANRQPEAMKVLLDETSISNRTDRKTYHRQHISTSDVPESAPRHEQQLPDGAETASPPELSGTDPHQQAPAIQAAPPKTVVPLSVDQLAQEPSRRDHAAADQPDTPDPTAP